MNISSIGSFSAMSLFSLTLANTPPARPRWRAFVRCRSRAIERSIVRSNTSWIDCVLAADPFRDRVNKIHHFQIIAKIRKHPPGFVDRESRRDLLRQDWLAIGRQSRQL